MFEGFLQIAERFGVPVALLVALLVGFWVMLKWFGKNVATPLVQSHLSLIDVLKETTKKNTETSEKLAESDRVKAKALEQLAIRQEETGKLVVTAITEQTEKLQVTLANQKPVNISVQPSGNGEHQKLTDSVNITTGS